MKPKRIHNTGRNKPERLAGLSGVPYGEAAIVRPGTQVVLLVGIEIDAPYSTTRVLTEKYRYGGNRDASGTDDPDPGPADLELDNMSYTVTPEYFIYTPRKYDSGHRT